VKGGVDILKDARESRPVSQEAEANAET